MGVKRGVTPCPSPSVLLLLLITLSRALTSKQRVTVGVKRGDTPCTPPPLFFLLLTFPRALPLKERVTVGVKRGEAPCTPPPLLLLLTLPRALTSKERVTVGVKRGEAPCPVSVIQPHSPPLPTHINRGVDVCAGRQQDFCRLHMPMNSRRVKWGELILKGDIIGKDDMHRDKTKERRTRGVGRGVNSHITSFPSKQKQPLSTRTRKGGVSL